MGTIQWILVYSRGGATITTTSTFSSLQKEGLTPTSSHSPAPPPETLKTTSVCLCLQVCLQGHFAEGEPHTRCLRCDQPLAEHRVPRFSNVCHVPALYFRAAQNDAAVGTHGVFMRMLFSCLGHTRRSTPLGHTVTVFTALRNRQTICQGSCTILLPTGQL